MSTSSAPAAAEQSQAPLLQRRAPSSPVFEMRSLSTDAERAEAAALVQDRERWLTLRGLPVPIRADIPALFRAPQAELAGLFEDGLLLACMTLQRAPDLGWGEGPCLFLATSTPCPTAPTTSSS